MIQLILILKKEGVIIFRQDFLTVIDLKKQNYRQITEGNASFTVEHIRLACEHYKVNANWIMGFEKNIYR
jgi:hypothetical protein